MKKILLATTVLAMSAGFAAADVSVSGDGRMGIVSSDGNSEFWNRTRIKFSGSGTTDGGLSFGGSFRAGEAGDADENTSSKGSVFISGAFGKITMGSVDSGDSAAVGQLSSVGFTGLGSGNSISYAADGGETGTDNDADLTDSAGAKVLYTYSAGALTVNASTAQLSNDGANQQAYGLGVSYVAGAMTIAAGYGRNSVEGTGDLVGATGAITDMTAAVTYAMGATTLKAIYQNKSVDVTYEDADLNVGTAVSMGASVDHKIDAITLTAYSITTDVQSDLIDLDVSVNRMGVGVGYDLGGGATVKAGWAQISDVDGESASAMDVGVNFSF